MMKQDKGGALYGSPITMNIFDTEGETTPTRIITFKLFAVYAHNPSFYESDKFRHYLKGWTEAGHIPQKDICYVFSIVPVFRAEVIDECLQGYYLSGKKLRHCEGKADFIGYIQVSDDCPIWHQLGLLVAEWEVQNGN